MGKVGWRSVCGTACVGCRHGGCTESEVHAESELSVHHVLRCASRMCSIHVVVTVVAIVAVVAVVAVRAHGKATAAVAPDAAAGVIFVVTVWNDDVEWTRVLQWR
jgi:hypothetical protein